MKRVCAALAVLICLPLHAAAPCGADGTDLRIAGEMEASLRHELLDAWYPLSLDTACGGFLSDFSFDWKTDGPQNKMIVTQCRHVWTTSKAALFFNENRYLDFARHGFLFLKNRMWDGEYGGFFMLRGRKGDAVQEGDGRIKTAYGNAFAVFALAAYHGASGDTAALRLARDTFLWLDRHSRDPEYGGYVDRLGRDGSWLGTPIPDGGSGQAAWKDQNSSIHLLEAFTELYRFWPDSLLRRRILELLTVIRDTIVTDRGALTQFMARDWTPISFSGSPESVRRVAEFFDHVSFGHDVETACLMLEASCALGSAPDSRTLRVARRMVDHALVRGWDGTRGGFYESGTYPHGSDSLVVASRAKVWWAQAEGLKALLTMARLFPEDTRYIRCFRKQWRYIRDYLIDSEHGGWYAEGLDLNPHGRLGPKGFDWKVNYHESRALMQCIRMLRSAPEGAVE